MWGMTMKYAMRSLDLGITSLGGMTEERLNDEIP